MTKSFTEYDEYEFTLGQELEEMAKDDLRETKATRDNAIKALREWIETNPRIEKVRTDSSFLLRFLRARKFSIPMTQDCIERYLLLRKAQNCSIFQNLDMNIPNLLTLFKLGYLFALPERDALGRRIILYRPGVFDPNTYTNIELLKLHGIAYESLLENEENQIRGFVHLVDAAGISLKYLTLFTPKEVVRISKNGERFLPMRHKVIEAFNIHPSLKIALDFALGLLSQKLKSRVQINTTLENVKHVDKRLLPKEYGGTMPMQEMIALFHKELTEQRDVIMKNDDMQIKLELYSEKAREGAVSALRQSLNCSQPNDQNSYGLHGSFRKLEVD